MDQQVDVAAGAGGGVLGGAEHVHGLDPETVAVQLAGNAFGHAQPPVPVVLAGGFRVLFFILGGPR